MFSVDRLKCARRGVDTGPDVYGNVFVCVRTYIYIHICKRGGGDFNPRENSTKRKTARKTEGAPPPPPKRRNSGATAHVYVCARASTKFGTFEVEVCVARSTA